MSPPAGSVEREIKIAVASLSPVRLRLQTLGARLVMPRSLEHNRVFDRGGQLRRAGVLLRVREDGAGARLTVKGVASYEGQVKERAEHEVVVDDAATLARALEELGYRCVRRYEKRRETWRFEDAEVALDETPIGYFVEVEGPRPLEVALRLGLELEGAEALGYLALYERCREKDPELAADMLFAEGGVAGSGREEHEP